MATTTQKTYHYVFWSGENVFQAPATKAQTLKVTNPLSATLSWQFSPENGSGFDSIVFNGTQISTKSSGTADVTQDCVWNGENKAVFNYRQGFLSIADPLNPSGSVSVSLDVTVQLVLDSNGNIVSGGAGTDAPKQSFSLPWWAYALIAVAAIVAVWVIVRSLQHKSVVPDVSGAIEKVAKLAVLA